MMRLQALPRPSLQLVALLALGIGSFIFAQTGPAGVQRRMAALTTDLSVRLENDDGRLKDQIRRLRHLASRTPGENRPTLQRVDAALTEGGARVVRLTPDPAISNRFAVALTTSFAGLLDAVDRVEEMGGALADLHVMRTGSSASLSAAFAVSFPPLVQIQSGRDPVAQGWLGRDPFALGATGFMPSSYHRLTAITRTGAVSVATIDGLDYRIGEQIDNMVLTGIGDDTVELEVDSRHLELRFGVPGPLLRPY